MKQYHTQSVVSKSCSGRICVSDKATSISHIVKRSLRALTALFIFAGLSAVTHAEEVKETPATQADLTAVKEWRLSQVGDQAIIEGSSVTLVFGEKDEVSGSGGVNHYGGKYESKADGQITLQNIFSSQRAALDENLMNQESQFLRLLGNAKRALLSEGSLVLECDDKDDKKIRLVFVAVKNV
jgi:heat shock protein HslJ